MSPKSMSSNESSNDQENIVMKLINQNQDNVNEPNRLMNTHFKIKLDEIPIMCKYIIIIFSK